MDQQQKQFLADLTGIEAGLKQHAERQNERRAAFDLALSGLNEKTGKIREAFLDVRLVDAEGGKHQKAFSKEGQEKALDTFKATKKGYGLTAEDMKKVGMALKPIADATQQILATETKDGKPLFDTQADFERALTEELFTPMVRQGVLPENFVIDKYSEVQKLLDETFKAYKKRNAQDRDDREEDQAGEKGKRAGAGSGTDQFGAVMKNLAKAPTKLADKMGLDEKKRRRFGIAVESGKMLMSMAKLGTTMASWQVDPDSGKPRIETNMEKQLDPAKFGYKDKDPDDARSVIVQEKREKSLRPKLEMLGLTRAQQDDILEKMKIQEDIRFQSSKDGILDGGDAVKSLIADIILPGDALRKLDETIDSVHHEAQNMKAALKAAEAIDAALVARLDEHVRPGVGKSLAGLYKSAVDIDEIAEQAAATKIDDQAIIREFALAFESVFAQGLDPSLAPEGKSVRQAFVGSAQGGALQKNIKKDPAGAFAPLVQAADAAINGVLSRVDKSKLRAVDAAVMKSVAETVARQIDGQLVAALKDVAGASAAEAFDGLYAAEVNIKAAVAAATGTPADGDAVVRSYATAFHSAFAVAAPNPSDTTCIAIGKAMEAAMKSAADGGALASALATDVAAAFRPLLKAAETAIRTGMSKGGEDLKRALSSPEAQRQLAAKSAFPDGGKEAMDELEQSEEERKEYERQLVLIDEGGVAAAELHTIEILIEKLERDKAIAEMIVASAGLLTSLGTTTVSIMGQQMTEVTDTLVGEIVGPLKAAKLIVKFAVAMKAANDRRILLQKFGRSLNLAKKAVSPLQSTIQGFFNSKVEQVTFRAIEDALTLIQIASAILGSVPEPITLAVGKTMGAVATAGEGALKVSEMIYNEAMLSKGWNTTMAAIRNPRDRATGLAALKLNPTLGMHAIAWAGMEKVPADPIARNLLGTLGLNEQTLQVSGTEDKVRKYLETLLAEDRVFLDPDLVSPKWIPKPLALTVESWVVVSTRAADIAEPKLRRTSEVDILGAFKKVAAQDLTLLGNAARAGQLDEKTIDKHREEAKALVALLRNYRPIASDGSEHEDMAGIAAGYMKLATDREDALYQIAVENAGVQARDVARQKDRVTKQTVAIEVAISDGTVEMLAPAFKVGCELIRELQVVRVDEGGEDKALYEHTQIASLYAGLMDQVQAAAVALKDLEEEAKKKEVETT